MSMNLREQMAELLEQTADKKRRSTEDISRKRRVEIWLRMAAQIMTFANLEEFWISKTVISIVALSYPHDHSGGTVQELSFKNIRKMEGQVRRDPEAEDQEKR